MKNIRRRRIACFLVLVLVAVLGFGCGNGDEDEGETTVVIGLITDITGPAGPVYSRIQYSLEDLAKYINEEKPIPGSNWRPYYRRVKCNAISLSGQMILSLSKNGAKTTTIPISSHRFPSMPGLIVQRPISTLSSLISTRWMTCRQPGTLPCTYAAD